MKTKWGMWEHSTWIPSEYFVSDKDIFDKMDTMLRKAGFNICKFEHHTFEPEGYTATWILSESHLAIHTFPEDGRLHMQLSSCNFEKYVAFITLLHEAYRC